MCIRDSYYAAGFLVLLGLLPKFGALAQIIPSPVLGGAMLVMFGFVSLQGMQILARVDFANNEHNFLIAAAVSYTHLDVYKRQVCRFFWKVNSLTS